MCVHASMRNSQKRILYKMPIKAPRFSDRACARRQNGLQRGLHFVRAAPRYSKVLEEKLAGLLRRLLSRGMHDWRKRKDSLSSSSSLSLSLSPSPSPSPLSLFLSLSLSLYPKATDGDIGIVLAELWGYNSTRYFVRRLAEKGVRANSDFLEKILKLLRAFVEGNVRENCPGCCDRRNLNVSFPLNEIPRPQ